jgi:hypothetical protein
MFTVDASYKIQQPLAQFFVAQLINLEWVQSGGGEHQVYSAKSDIDDGAGRELVTAYALKRPDGEWSLLVVNRDQENAHRVRIAFRGAVPGKPDSSAGFAGPVEFATFGSAQYKWNPPRTRFMAHAEIAAAPRLLPTRTARLTPTDLFCDQNRLALKTRFTISRLRRLLSSAEALQRAETRAGARATRPGTWFLNNVYREYDQRNPAPRPLLLYCC